MGAQKPAHDKVIVIQDDEEPIRPHELGMSFSLHVKDVLDSHSSPCKKYFIFNPLSTSHYPCLIHLTCGILYSRRYTTK